MKFCFPSIIFSNQSLPSTFRNQISRRFSLLHWLIAQVRKARRSLLPGLLDDVAAALPPTPAPPAGLGDACRRLAENTFAGVVADGYPVCGSIDMAAVASNLYL